MSAPVKFTKSVPISGIGETEKDVPVQLNAAGNYVKMTDNARVEGLLLLTEKADTGDTPSRGTLQYMDRIKFKIADSVTLTDADKKKGIKGAANGAIKLVAYSSTYDENLNGRVMDYSNTTGDKWVEVLL